MGNVNDRPHGDSDHSYFVKRKLGDLHYAWLWLKHLAQNKTSRDEYSQGHYIVGHHKSTS